MADRPTKPTPAGGFTNTDALPAYLKEHGLFCVWRYEWDANREKGKGGWTKPPYNPNRPQYHAASDNPATFASMNKAAAAGRAHGFDGMGIGVFGAVAAIDIDHCISGGELSDMARDIVATMDAYTEISPSGEGIRILFLAPDLRYDSTVYYIHNQKTGLEIYLPGMTRKYLTVTGNVLRARDMENREGRLQTILDKYMKQPQAPAISASSPAAPLTISDRELIDKASNAKNGAQFCSLWRGEITGFPSHSEADQALCNLLAFWTRGDFDRIDSLFRQSGLYRDKWERERYRTVTIEKAIASCNGNYYNPQPLPRESSERPQTAQKAQQQAPGDLDKEAETPQQEAPQNAPQPATAPARSSVELFDSFMEKIQTDVYKPIPTGMAAFDGLLRGGIPRQAVVILLAAPAAGKTTLAQQIFEAAATHGTDVIYLNLEMSREQLLARSLSRMIHKEGGNISADEVMEGYNWTEAQRRFIEAAAARYRAEIAPHMDYNPDGCGADLDSIMEMLNRAGDTARAAGKPAPAICLDYLHLVRVQEARGDLQEMIKIIMGRLKAWAIQYDSYVFAISATNRTTNNSGKISLYSGRDSSNLEYGADIVLSLNYREIHEQRIDATDPDAMGALETAPNRNMLIQVLKNRMKGGCTGRKLYLLFHAASGTFTPETDQTPPPLSTKQLGFIEVNDPNLPDF